MFVDAHAHIVPAEMIERRDELCRRDATFAELFGDPGSKLATAAELLAALDRNGTEYAVAAGFAWTDPALCREHNDELLAAGRLQHGRLLPFCTVNPAGGVEAWHELERCAAAGARGVGELRPDAVGADLTGPAGELLARASSELGLVLLFHASEPVGHGYPGKLGGGLAVLWRFITAHPEARVICAHWGGGLPFYALMPEVRRSLANVWFDTAATTLLYDPAIYRTVIDLVGAERLLFGSDFPLLGPKRQRQALLAAPLSAYEQARILGENAASLFGLPDSHAATAPLRQAPSGEV